MLGLCCCMAFILHRCREYQISLDLLLSRSRHQVQIVCVTHWHNHRLEQTWRWAPVALSSRRKFGPESVSYCITCDRYPGWACPGQTELLLHRIRTHWYSWYQAAPRTSDGYCTQIHSFRLLSRGRLKKLSHIILLVSSGTLNQPSMLLHVTVSPRTHHPAWY